MSWYGWAREGWVGMASDSVPLVELGWALAHCLLHTTCYLIVATYCLLLTTHCLLVATSHLLFTTCYLTACYLLPTTHYVIRAP